MPDLGEKHECPKCGVKFYDLGKSEPECPKCGVEEAEKDSKKKRAAADDSEKE